MNASILFGNSQQSSVSRRSNITALIPTSNFDLQHALALGPGPNADASLTQGGESCSFCKKGDRIHHGVVLIDRERRQSRARLRIKHRNVGTPGRTNQLPRWRMFQSTDFILAPLSR